VLEEVHLEDVSEEFFIIIQDFKLNQGFRELSLNMVERGRLFDLIILAFLVDAFEGSLLEGRSVLALGPCGFLPLLLEHLNLFLDLRVVLH